MAYTPSQHTVTNKALGIGQATPTDARSYYFQSDIFVYRCYQSTAEVLAYLDTEASRTGNFSIFINDGTLDSTTGEFTGGVVTEYWFKDGVADGDLVEKASGGGGFDLGWYNVKDFGAIGDGVTDDTTAMQDAIDTCNADGGGIVYFPKGIYRGTIVIPYNDYSDTDTQVAIKLLGESPSVPNFNPLETVSARPVNQTGVIILGNTIADGVVDTIAKSAGANTSWTVMSFVNFSMENITVRLKSINASSVDMAPKDVAIDMSSCSMMTLKNVTVDTESMSNSLVQPATTCVGIITPARGNWTKNYINECAIIGCYKGLIASEHASLTNVYFDANYYCIVLPDSDHPIHGDRIGFWRYKYGIKVEGTTTRGISIDQLALERNSIGEWFDYTADLVEASPGYAIGKIEWFVVTGGAFTFVRTNPTGSRIFDISMFGSVPRWATADRPSNIDLGTIGFNTTTNALEFWNGTLWKSVATPAGTSGQLQYNNSGSFGGFGNWDNGTSLLTIAGNILLSGGTRNLSFGTGYGVSALTLYDGGAGGRYGWGLNSAEMQFFITTGAHVSFNRGGDFQASGTNEFFRIDEALGLLLAASKYFNFGTTLGSTGYGIRDNAGVIEKKDSGGSWVPIGSGAGGVDTLNVQYTDVANSGTSETDLMSYTLPANQLLNVGDRLIIEAAFTTPSNANSKTLKFYFGTFSQTWTSGYFAAGVTAKVKATIIKTGSNAQKIVYEFYTSFNVSEGVATATVNDTTTETIKFTGTSGTASNDITQSTMTVTYYPI